MRLNVSLLLLACCLGLRAQDDFAICRDAGPEMLRQPAHNPQTEFCIGYLYASGRGVAKDMAVAVSHFRAAAEKGYTAAQAVLGVNYAKGLGVAQNWTEAALWFRKAMIGGNTSAALNLGQCYQNGHGVPRDLAQAASLYRFAASRGDQRAAPLLAQLSGSPPPALFAGSPQPATDPTNVVHKNWAYEQQQIPFHTYRVPLDRVSQLLNDHPACTVRQPGIVSCRGVIAGNYGQFELHGVHAPAAPPASRAPQPVRTYPIPSRQPPAGVPAAQRAQAENLWQRAVELLNRDDPRDAMPLLYQCALLGDRRAEATLGIRYQDGDGVSEDDRSAAYWFGLAAAQGHRASQYALGGMYLDGEGGLPKDVPKAIELFKKSVDQGYDKAQLALGIFYEFGEGVPRDRTKAIALIRQSGLANDIASVLANPRTPRSFANEDVFGAYLTSLHNAQIVATWSQSRSSLGVWNDPYFNRNSTYWQNRRHQESLGK